MTFPLTLARISLIALFAPTLALAQPVEPHFSVRAAALVERHRVNVDGLLGNARQEGMALLVIPTLNLDAQSRRDFNDDATRDSFVRQRSTFMHWNHNSQEGYVISAGAGDHKLNPTDPGPQFQTARGKLLYQVIPVWPGKYRLNRITYHQPRTQLPDTAPPQNAMYRLKKIGLATLNRTVDREFKMITPQVETGEEDNDGLGKGCEVMLRSGGGCDEAAREVRWRLNSEIAFSAGQAEAAPAPGIRAELLFSPIASIKLEAGEAVLTDGFTMPVDQPVMTPASCQDTSLGRTCTMDSLTLTRLPASLDDFRQAPGAASFNLPMLNAALRDLTYRAPTLYYKPVSEAEPNVFWAVGNN